MVVKVDTAEFDPEGDPALAYGCEFRPVSPEFDHCSGGSRIARGKGANP